MSEKSVTQIERIERALNFTSQKDEEMITNLLTYIITMHYCYYSDDDQDE